MSATEAYSTWSIQTDIREVPLTDITPSPRNVRTRFDEAELEELADSIRQHGLIEPIVVRSIEGAPGRREPAGPYATLEIIVGERRWRAAALAGLTTIWARVMHDVDDATALKLGLVENLQRVDLDPIEEAEGYHLLAAELGMKQREIADTIHRSQQTVSKTMQLLDLPEDVRELVRSGQLSAGHGAAILRFRESPAIMSKLAERAVATKTPVRTLEQGVPFQYELEQAKLTVSVYAMTSFRETCLACPLSAYRRLGDLHGICLRPDHFAELSEQAKGAAQAKAEEARAAGGDGLVDTTELGYDNYESLRFGKRPSGCSEDCPCQAMAKGRSGENPYPICIDPKRFRQLRAADQKAEKAAKRDALKTRTAALEEHVISLEMCGPRELAIVCAAALSTLSKPSCGQAAAARFFPGLADLSFNRWELRTSGVPWLVDAAGDDDDALIRVAVEALLRQELAERYEGYGERTALNDWYIDGKELAAPGDVIDSDDDERLTGASLRSSADYGQCRVCTGELGPEDEPGMCAECFDESACRVCSGPLTAEAIDAGDGLCAECWALHQGEAAGDAE